MILGHIAGLRGRLREAADLFLRAAKEGSGSQGAQARIQAAIVLLGRGEPALARAQAEAARREAGPLDVAQQALFWRARCLAVEGRHEEARAAADELRREISGWPVPWARRLLLLLEGDLAAARGGTEAAAREYAEAERLLPPLERPPPFKPDFIRIRYALAETLLAQGREGEAARRFAFITEPKGARVYQPISYVRSFYFLGRIAEKQGDREGARKHYQRFLDYWKDGDADRERVADAQRKIERLAKDPG
jgi:tetratricopeptide (TPR) repeat protein